MSRDVFDDYEDDQIHQVVKYKSDFIDYNTLLCCLELFRFDLDVDPCIESWKDFIEFLKEERELIGYDKDWSLLFDDIDEKEPLPFTYRDDSNDGNFFLIEDIVKISKRYKITTEENREKHINKIEELHNLMLTCHNYNTITQNDNNKNMNRTAKATEARQQNQLKQWQSAFRDMVKIRDIIIQQGPKKRTERELWKMFEDKSLKISKTQMRFFKTLLPDGYVDREGGAPRQ